MTAAVTLAVLGGALAACGLVDAVVAWRTAARRRALRGDEGPRRLSRVLERVGAGLAAIGRRSPARAPGGLGVRLDAAGSGLSPADAIALKWGCALSGAAVAVLSASGLPGRLGWLWMLSAPVSAFLALDARLWVRSRARARVMEAELADVLELLRVGVEAGLGVRRALEEVGRRHPGILARELRRTAALLSLGMAYADALEVLRRRCPADGIGVLVAALRRAERHGTPLAPALAAQAQEARGRRARAAAETAARAAPKIQLVVALLLVPSAMLLVAAALIPALAWD